MAMEELANIVDQKYLLLFPCTLKNILDEHAGHLI